MRLSILAFLFCLVLSGGAAAKKTVECTDPDTKEAFTVTVPQVRRGQADLKRKLKRSGFHMLDLSQSAQDASRALARALAAKSWCAAALQVRVLHAEISNVRLHPELVSEKFARLERWVRGAEWPQSTQTRAERILANVAAKIAQGDHLVANKQLNGLIGVLFNTRTVWDLPQALPELKNVEPAGGARAQLKEAHIKAGCPKLTKQGSASAGDLKDLRRTLQSLMNGRKLRVTDIDEGPALLQDLQSYVELKAFWPAARVLCSIKGQLAQMEIDLGFTMARFHLINQLSREGTRTAEEDARFRELVRSASAAIADANFQDAHRDLEALLVLLGQPDPPAAALPPLSG